MGNYEKKESGIVDILKRYRKVILIIFIILIPVLFFVSQYAFNKFNVSIPEDAVVIKIDKTQSPITAQELHITTPIVERSLQRENMQMEAIDVIESIKVADHKTESSVIGSISLYIEDDSLFETEEQKKLFLDILSQELINDYLGKKIPVEIKRQQANILPLEAASCSEQLALLENNVSQVQLYLDRAIKISLDATADSDGAYLENLREIESHFQEISYNIEKASNDYDIILLKKVIKELEASFLDAMPIEQEGLSIILAAKKTELFVLQEEISSTEVLTVEELQLEHYNEQLVQIVKESSDYLSDLFSTEGIYKGVVTYQAMEQNLEQTPLLYIFIAIIGSAVACAFISMVLVSATWAKEEKERSNENSSN